MCLFNIRENQHSTRGIYAHISLVVCIRVFSLKLWVSTLASLKGSSLLSSVNEGFYSSLHPLIHPSTHSSIHPTFYSTLSLARCCTVFLFVSFVLPG